jgi:hypothetical protein
VKPVGTAQSEIDSAASWYEARKEGLGSEFLDRVSETLERIEIHPQGYAEGYRGFAGRTSINFLMDCGFSFGPITAS